jgi:catechol 2,3-dioxygenase-like lactoylglutathione lyase family enzyme
MIDHTGINVSDYARSRDFYSAALEPLGFTFGMEPMPGIGGFLEPVPGGSKPTFWITDQRKPVTTNVHLAFAAPDRPTVDAFHAAALAAGGTDNGAPGVREIYHPHYYGAYVLDPDGNNVEAVCHRPAEV